jgi:hypothetical protein
MTASKLYKTILAVSFICLSLTVIIGAVLVKLNDSSYSSSKLAAGIAMLLTGGFLLVVWVIAICSFCERHETRVKAFGMTMSVGGGGVRGPDGMGGYGSGCSGGGGGGGCSGGGGG